MTSLERVAEGLLVADLEWRTARGMASGSLKGRRFRDLGSLGGVRGGELGGSESELEETISKVPLRWGKRKERVEVEEVSGVYLKG